MPRVPPIDIAAVYDVAFRVDARVMDVMVDVNIRWIVGSLTRDVLDVW